MNFRISYLVTAMALLLIGLPLAIAVTLTAPQPARADPGVLYAAPTAQGSGDCSSWDNACTLQTALAQAQSGDEIWVKAGVHYPGAAGNRTATFTLKNGVALYGGFAGTETARDQRDWQTNITILSGDIDQNDINTDGNYIAETWNDIQGANAYHVVTGSGVTEMAVIDGLVITAGQANGSNPPDDWGGGMYNYWYSSPTLTNVTFSGNYADADGGGMYNYCYSSPTLTNVAFSSNYAANQGGGMSNYEYSSPSLTNVSFSGNSANNNGGGMYNYWYSSPTLTNVTFSSNSAASGGGMYNSYSSPTLVNVTFSGNTASSGGGMGNNYSGPHLVNVTFSGNQAGWGGGMWNDYSSPNLVNVTFSGNAAHAAGGGMITHSGSPTLMAVIFNGNTAGEFGGGMLNQWTQPALTDVTFSNNQAGERGGGIFNWWQGSPTLTNVTFSGNTAPYGGGLYNQSYCNPTLTNVSFSSNSATYGGGMHNYYYSNPTLTNVTFSGNSATYGGGIYNTDQSNPSIANTILWGNSAPNGAEIYNTGGSTPTITYSDVRGGYAGGGNIDADPLFVDAVGGNLRLQLTSPAIDAGNNAAVPPGVTTDLDGNPRFVDIPTVPDTGNGTPPIVDMGAYEAVPVLYAVPDGLESGGCSSWANACTLRYALGKAIGGQEIWVQAGVHYPGAAGDRTATFTLKNGVALYGGFAGTETSRDARDWQTHITVLSGDIDRNDLTDPHGVVTDTANIVGDNTYHVVVGNGVNETAVLDGFTITAGLGNLWFPDNHGGGMRNDHSSPTLRNLIFSGNWAAQGGGLQNDNGSNPTLTNIAFSGNWAAAGGGGLANSWSSPTLINVTFSDNFAGYAGGGMVNDFSSPTLTNITFSGNTANEYGGGMSNNNNSNPALTNVILWDNSAPTGPEIYNMSGNPSISYSDIQGCGGSGSGWNPACGADGGGNIDADPRFVDAANGDLHLYLNSPCIDAGDNTAVPAGIITDLDGNPRFADIPTVPDTGNGTPPIVDMGAYEAFAVLHAAPTASGSGDCSSWADACLLQTALTNATSGYQIWVKAGVHKSTTTTDRTISFALKSGVALYGGFAGTESQRDQRDWQANPTVLSGDIDGNDVNTDGNFIAETWNDIVGENAYHVVTGSGVTETAVLDGFTITAGQANDPYGNWPHLVGGGMYNSYSSLALANLTFSGNAASYGGGGMYNTDNSSPTLNNVTFSGNSANRYGGGMYNDLYSSPTLTAVTFSTNSANSGGGMCDDNSSPTLTNVTFSGNTGTNGGGMYNDNSNPALSNVAFSGNTAANGGGMSNSYSNPTLTDITFYSNTATTSGGAINNFASSPVLTHVTFYSNSATTWGGAMFNSTSSPVLTDVVFSGNSAAEGGGIYGKWGSHAALNGVTFSGNLATSGAGGGMYNYVNSHPTLEHVTFSGNSAATYGGGLYSYYGNPTLNSVTFAGNSALRGGGMLNDGSHAQLTNVTFSGNSADIWGGGMCNGNSRPTLVNVTFDGNTAAIGGGLCNDWGSRATLVNVIIANSGGGGDCALGPDSVITASHTLIEDTGASACGLANGVDGNLIGYDPRLGPLQDNGGDTLTHALLPGSPAIDAGTNIGCPLTDQRGALRPIGFGCDMGAYELAAFSASLGKFTGDLSPAPGQVLPFTIVVTNTGPGFTGGLISDTMPAHLDFVGPITLDPPDAGIAGTMPPTLAHSLVISANQRVTVTFSVSVAWGLVEGTVITNTATFSSPALSMTEIASLTLVVANAAPVADDDAFDVDEESTAELDVLDGDSDENGDALSISAVGTPDHGGTAIHNGVLITYTPATNFASVEVFTYTVADGHGGFDSAWITITVANVNDAPSFTSAPVLTATQGVTYTYAVAATDPDLPYGDVLTITASTLPVWLTLTDHGNGTAALSGTPTNADVGDHPVVLQVADSGGLSDTQSFTVTVANVNDAPSFTSAPALTATQDVTYTYAVAATDPDLPHGDVLTVTAPTLPAWLTLTDHGNGTATLAGTPSNADVGGHPVVLRVSDSGGLTDTQSFTLTVANVNDAPAFTSAPVTAAVQGLLYTYAVAATDPDLPYGDVLTVTAPTLPTWLTLQDHGDGTAALSGTPTDADVGDHPVVLRVTDRGGLFAGQSFTITVTAKPGYTVFLPLVFKSTP